MAQHVWINKKITTTTKQQQQQNEEQLYIQSKDKIRSIKTISRKLTTTKQKNEV